MTNSSIASNTHPTDSVNDVTQTDTIVLKPAKKVVGLYALGVAVALVLVTVVVRFLHTALEIDESLLMLPWLVVLGVGCLVVLYAYVWRHCITYSMNETHITSDTGILSKQHLRIPLSRVTNYWIKRTFIERLLGLADLYIDTAGGNDVELIMLELNKGDAQKFYQTLGVYLKSYPGAAELGSVGASGVALAARR